MGLRYVMLALLPIGLLAQSDRHTLVERASVGPEADSPLAQIELSVKATGPSRPAWLTIHLQNTSDRKLTLLEGTDDYRVKVLDVSGHLVGPPKPSRRARLAALRSFDTVVYDHDCCIPSLREIAPGEKTPDDERDLAALFDLRRPGTYSVFVSRDVHRSIGESVSLAAKITFTLHKHGLN